MACDYKAIRTDNERNYGTHVPRYGRRLLADRYDDRTHFIFELLQNAEDALARRDDWRGTCAVKFYLANDHLRVNHFGKPFDEADVRGICGIAESTKALTDIGRFGIGFKSVYAVTDRPEIHSGMEDFAVESFVWPTEVPELDRSADETVFLLPLKEPVVDLRMDIAAGLQRLGPATLLFLRRINEIEWSVAGGPSGQYLRTDLDQSGDNVRRVTVIGQEVGKPEIEDTWLVFSHPVTTDDDKITGYAEIAFSMASPDDPQSASIQPVKSSPLVVFFPTVRETHLGFRVQGPYRTTPSRDNVPPDDPWNQRIVGETALLLVKALRWLRDHKLIDSAMLGCLPIDPTRFGKTNMFAPLFDATKQALLSESLLPRFDTGYVPGACARLSRTQDLRVLFTASQLAALLGESKEIHWLSGDITSDNAPELRRYLIQELGIAEMTPETIVPRLELTFLEAQPDEWILKLYEFLSGKSGLRRKLGELSLIRLENGRHVPPRTNGQPLAFLPGTIRSGFPTVRYSVCATETAREFLKSLGLTEPDPVDDVIRHVLPKYRKNEVEASPLDYDADMKRILRAFITDSKVQQEKLIAALKETPFIMAVEAGNGSRKMTTASNVYLATERLKALFNGIGGVLLVDDSNACLRGEEMRTLLEACGAVRYLRPIEDSSISLVELHNLRVNSGHQETSGVNDRVTDWNCDGLSELFEAFPRLGIEERATISKLLWEELAQLEERRGKTVFSGEYTWTHYGNYRADFDAAFVRKLNVAAWVPDAKGDLQRPELILFDTLGWKPDPFLLSKISFKPPIIDQLAKEAGIEPGVLDLLKKLGVTSEAELRDRLGLKHEPTAAGEGSGNEVEGALKKLLGNVSAPTPPVPDPIGAEPSGPGSGRGGGGTGVGGGSISSKDAGERSDGQGGGRPRGIGAGSTKRTPGGAGGRPFISYIAAQPDEEDRDPEGLDQPTRMALEARAIELILVNEPQWQRTATHNPGFDLFEPGDDDKPVRWCEVKAMTGSLHDRPVGLSQTQFECAQEHGEAYWLYVVEHAGSDSARIVRIQDPVGKARTFLFDHGWLSIANVTDASSSQDSEHAREE